MNWFAAFYLYIFPLLLAAVVWCWILISDWQERRRGRPNSHIEE
ncbi:hypothetical protein SAMN03159496_04203 [Rhizobium sp. NFR07]|nr:hypothetical protein [Rhizobium sp. NFR07]SFB48665.1 hypothetical protein SAMN03159496_04203 [Rhizobium sp. NFR07]